MPNLVLIVCSFVVAGVIGCVLGAWLVRMSDREASGRRKSVPPVSRRDDWQEIAEKESAMNRSLRLDLEKAYALVREKESVAANPVPSPAKETDYLRQIAFGIDALAIEQQKFRRGFDAWVRVNFGNGSAGYSEMTDEEASLRETADSYMRRYGGSYEDAMARARITHTYKGSGMGGAA